MMDPKRDAALVEIQNFIKKNLGKKLAMASQINSTKNWYNSSI